MSLTQVGPDLISSVAGVSGLPASAGYAFVSQVAVSNTPSDVSFTGMEAGYDYHITVIDQRGSGAYHFYGYLGVTGPTYRTADYKMGQRYISYNSTSTAWATTDKIWFNGTNGGYTRPQGWNGTMTLHDPANASSYTQIQGMGSVMNTANNQYVGYFNGTHQTAEAHTAIKFTQSSGTMKEGIFKLYRRPNA